MRARPSVEDADMFRYEMFNRSALCQDVIGRPQILEVVEPLLGEDCHVISCTAWNNPPGNTLGTGSLEWHVDGGPHVPRGRGILWPRSIPFPVFVVATHLYLTEVGQAEGATAFVPGSHTSGAVPPTKHRKQERLSYRFRRSVTHLASPGDVSFFVSDVWHRRLTPSAESAGRFFLQTNYGRREIAQRVRPTDEVNHASPEAIARARTDRERQLIGLHPQAFYDG
jgi:ectoine hydroxylase-related dioxygenase (phytanoyl-CoA dioxygenase family)